MVAGHHYFDPHHGKEDYRTATAWMTERVPAGDRGDRRRKPGAPRVLLERPQAGYKDSFWLGLAADSIDMVARFDTLRDSSRTAYVVVSRPYAFDARGRFESSCALRAPAKPRSRA